MVSEIWWLGRTSIFSVFDIHIWHFNRTLLKPDECWQKLNVWWITPLSQVVQCSVDGYTWMCNHSFSLAVHVSIAFYKTVLSESVVYVHLSLMAVLMDEISYFSFERCVIVDFSLLIGMISCFKNCFGAVIFYFLWIRVQYQSF